MLSCTLEFIHFRMLGLTFNLQDGYGHGFFNFVSVIPQVHKMLDLVSVWMLEMMYDSPAERVVIEPKKS